MNIIKQTKCDVVEKLKEYAYFPPALMLTFGAHVIPLKNIPPDKIKKKKK